jgi:hypothetical protein
MQLTLVYQILHYEFPIGDEPLAADYRSGFWI